MTSNTWATSTNTTFMPSPRCQGRQPVRSRSPSSSQRQPSQQTAVAPAPEYAPTRPAHPSGTPSVPHPGEPSKAGLRVEPPEPTRHEAGRAAAGHERASASTGCGYGRATPSVCRPNLGRSVERSAGGARPTVIESSAFDHVPGHLGKALLRNGKPAQSLTGARVRAPQVGGRDDLPSFGGEVQFRPVRSAGF